MRYTRVYNARYAHVIYAKLSNPEMTSYMLGPRATSSRDKRIEYCARKAGEMTESVYSSRVSRTVRPDGERETRLSCSLGSVRLKQFAEQVPCCKSGRCQYLMWSESKINFTAWVLAASTKSWKSRISLSSLSLMSYLSHICRIFSLLTKRYCLYYYINNLCFG